MTTHLDDADLIRHLDGATDPADRLAVAGHLEDCPTCAARLDIVRGRRHRLASMLAATDVRVPAFTPPSRALRWRSPHRLAIAAVITLTIAGVAVRPVRAWIVDRGRDLWTIVAGESVVPVPAPPPAPTPETPAATAAVEFVPRGSTVAIRLRARQSRGSITVATGPDTAVVAEVIGGGEREELLVGPNGLVIRNAEASLASYRLTLPMTLDSIRIEVAGITLATFAPRGAASTWTVSLAPGPVP